MTSNVHATLRRLMEAAARFEKVAAHHRRIEAERKALLDALDTPAMHDMFGAA